MTGLVLVLWALLVSAEFADGTTSPSANLSCYRCFKVTKASQCKPTKCSPTDQVCVSNALVIFLRLRTRLLVSKRCAPRCPNSNMKYEWYRGQVLSTITRQCCARNLCNRTPATWQGPWALQLGLWLPLGLGLLRALL